MNPRLRTALLTLAASAAAVFLGAELAQGSYAWPALAAVVIATCVLVRLLRIAADVILLGFLVVGYIIGNRGFAQLMPVSGVPLLPAEIGLLVAGTWRTILCAFERRLPLQRDPLNWAVLAWLVIGTTRVVFDVPRFGILALRDFAMVYYAAFFFLAQHMGREPAARRYLVNCLLFAVVALLPVFALFQLFPVFFTSQLTVMGAPVIYFKGDLVITFMAVGSVLLFHWARGSHRFWAWPYSAVMFLLVMSWDNRASLLGAVVASGFLLLARRWRFPAVQGGLTAAGLLVVVALAVVFENTWAEQKVHGLTDRLQSIGDMTGSGQYESEESRFKGDNNRFRLVWWRNVVTEAWSTNPVFGLGFGADLTQGFLQEYYPELGDEFGIRSPHNIFITTFGRMGLLGLATWLFFCLTLLGRTWHSLRHTDDPVAWSLWCSGWVILVSGTFGVVLEGPMGAVVFWMALGLANSSPESEAAKPAASLAPPESRPQSPAMAVT